MDSAYRASSTETDSTPTSMRVVTAVAEREGTDPLELTEPLYRAIDPDALDSLFDGRPGADGRITFQYHGYRVTVHDDGDVDVTPRH